MTKNDRPVLTDRRSSRAQINACQSAISGRVAQASGQDIGGVGREGEARGPIELILSGPNFSQEPNFVLRFKNKSDAGTEDVGNEAPKSEGRTLYIWGSNEGVLKFR